MQPWFRSYFYLVKWNVLRQKSELPYIFVIQALLSIGVVVGFSFLIPDLDQRSALYLTTGAMTISLITVGLAVAPGSLAYQKQQGILDYQRSLPVPRMALLAASATIWVVIAIPGFFLTLLAASLRFSLEFTMSPLVIPALLLVIAGTVSMGYAVAYLVRPTMVNMVTNFILIGALMFAPLNYPAERLPDWLATVHQFLPLQYMAQAVREAVDVPASGISLLPYLILAVWGALGIAVATWVTTRRV
ncbi:ABC transporter permease [Natronoglycomyces albus]|uniref:ABC transporter permease n=1 Tax=Natronoglycomyces albus TaxID=2811108 RepID=A0A895XT84_9ACTN|nr:ABC transporter permease [Natronoglycomyces albus]QSB06703.1 ABC transporter permease [Natronoglycomyces albus]